MAKVFVHGNPEVAAIWDPLFGALADRGVDDCVALSPPGFGAAVPEAFSATPAAYVDWLVGELAAMDTTIDLVGHDWGAGHVAGLAGQAPELIRSWATDCAALLHPDYEWHDAARTWRTPGEGEAAIAGLVELPTDELVAAYAGLGMPDEIARPMAEAADADLGRCVLALYRAADREVLDAIAERLRTAEHRPGLLLSAEADPYVPAAMAPDVAELVGATIAPLTGLGHWWMIEDPDAAADALTAFWSTLD